jgi:hypothetical protein
MTKKEAAKWQEEIGKVKKNAAPMKNLTKKQKEEMERMGPPKPGYSK